ncbi:MAG: HAMP domain-containing histidine kinase [Proteobacteria bacterium]|nr:HAMP domain-containing histidine kinase [Pseudomonadota bacterium]
MRVKNLIDSLYWKIGALFLVLLIFTGAIFIYVTAFTAEMYVQEATQKVSRPIAQYIALKANPFKDNKIDQKMLRLIFDSASMMNPGVEVYLLDPQGTLLASSVPWKQVERKMIALDPINKFLGCDRNCFVLGDDPHVISGDKVFSVAPVLTNNEIRGYVYVILRGGEYDSATGMIFDSYFLPLSLKSFGITLLISAVMSLLVLRILTRKLRKLTVVANAYGRRDFSERISVSSRDEIDRIAIALNQMADTIVEYMGEIENTDQLRRELVANVSHDLRTPLASIQGYVETLLLKLGKLKLEEQKEYLNIVLNGTIKLVGRVEELFELSKLDAAQFVLNPEPFALTDLIQDVILKFNPEVEKTNLQLAVDMPKNLPLVSADIGLIERVLQNLVDNAIRYSPEKSVISIRISPLVENLRVDVLDEGSGIFSEDLPFIFDRFYRGQQDTSRNSRGSGLGLAIASKIISLHNSELSVESSPDKGSCFSFTLPLVS